MRFKEADKNGAIVITPEHPCALQMGGEER